MHLTLNRLLTLFCVLLVLGGLLWTALVGLMARAILRPPRMSAGKAIYYLRRLSPGDLGLPYEEENFPTRDRRTGDRLNISGWWIPAHAASDRCVVLVHGYADAKVGAIAWAPLLHGLKLNILAIDLRAHGDSQGKYTTGGFFERDDVGQVIDQILGSRPDETRQLLLFGISLGAAVAVAVASQRSDITAMVLESPFADYEKAIAANTALMGLPGGWTVTAAIAFAKFVSGARFETVRPVELLANLKCPVLSIVGAEDELLDSSDIAALRQATQKVPGSTFWLVDEAAHLRAMTLDPAAYAQKIRGFLTANDVCVPPGSVLPK
jgi:pimeloyl-ACP methyl ester carboxylesterase